MGRPLLDHYHNALLTFGVTGHTRRALQDDYRRFVLTRMAPPVAGGGSDPAGEPVEQPGAHPVGRGLSEGSRFSAVLFLLLTNSSAYKNNYRT
jgi:hypothetical protein